MYNMRQFSIALFLLLLPANATNRQLAFKTAVVLCLLAGTMWGKKKPDVTITTDRFTQETTVREKLFALGSFRGGGYNNGTFYFAMSATFPKNLGYFVALVIDANEWQYVREGGVTVHFIADGQHFDVFFKEGSTRVPVTAAGVSTQEVLAAFPEISAEQFGKMANAKDLEIEIGPYAFKFNERGIQHFKDLFDAVQSCNVCK